MLQACDKVVLDCLLDYLFLCHCLHGFKVSVTFVYVKQNLQCELYTLKHWLYITIALTFEQFPITKLISVHGFAEDEMM